MAFHNPKGRANYEPNSWGPDEGGPRESAEKGFASFPEPGDGPKLRYRSETFADHYSQARQFYISQAPVEQLHIANALVFELSKVETPKIRIRMVSHLRNIDEGLAKKVADGLRIKDMPEPADAAMPTKKLDESPALSIVRNGPDSFAGRKLGVLVTDGANIDLIDALRDAMEERGAKVEFIAPSVGGVETSDGSWLDAKQKIDGGPSVLYDAVAIIASDDGVADLCKEPAARDFVCDAFAHNKFIAYAASVLPLFEKAGIASDLDEGCFRIDSESDVTPFAERCGELRLWERELKRAGEKKDAKRERS